jgi:hypothetical protein
MASKGLSPRRFRLISAETRSSSVGDEWKELGGENQEGRNCEGEEPRHKAFYRCGITQENEIFQVYCLAYLALFPSRALGSASQSSINTSTGFLCALSLCRNCLGMPRYLARVRTMTLSVWPLSTGSSGRTTPLSDWATCNLVPWMSSWALVILRGKGGSARSGAFQFRTWT